MSRTPCAQECYHHISAKSTQSHLTLQRCQYVAAERMVAVVQASKAKMDAMKQAEASKAQAAQAKNELEAYIISTQSALSSNEDFQVVTTEKQREAFSAALSEVEDWLYDEGQHEQAPIFRSAACFLTDLLFVCVCFSFLTSCSTRK